MVLAIGTYIVGSLLTYKPYDLDKLLHRGIYSDTPEAPKETWSFARVMDIMIGIGSEYTFGDKVITWSVFLFTFLYQMLLTFVVVVIWNAFDPWPKEWWNSYFYITSLVVPGLTGIISTVWFSIGGYVDIRRLFRDLARRVEDPDDNGQVEEDISGNGENDIPSGGISPNAEEVC